MARVGAQQLALEGRRVRRRALLRAAAALRILLRPVQPRLQLRPGRITPGEHLLLERLLRGVELVALGEQPGGDAPGLLLLRQESADDRGLVRPLPVLDVAEAARNLARALRLLGRLDRREELHRAAPALDVVALDRADGADIVRAGNHGILGYLLRRALAQGGADEHTPLVVEPAAVHRARRPEVEAVEAVLEVAAPAFAHEIRLRPRHVERHGIRHEHGGGARGEEQHQSAPVASDVKVEIGVVSR